MSSHENQTALRKQLEEDLNSMLWIRTGFPLCPTSTSIESDRLGVTVASAPRSITTVSQVVAAGCLDSADKAHNTGKAHYTAATMLSEETNNISSSIEEMASGGSPTNKCGTKSRLHADCNENLPKLSSPLLMAPDIAIWSGRNSMEPDWSPELSSMQYEDALIPPVAASLPSQEAADSGIEAFNFSIDIDDMHISKMVLNAMHTTSLGNLFENDISFRARTVQKLQSGRNFDLIGKVAFWTKMKALGASSRQIIVDAAHSGGLCESDDGILPFKEAFLEIKGSGPKSRATSKQGRKAQVQYEFKKVRTNGTRWKYLILVCKRCSPDNWERAEDYDRAGFWLGLVTRQTFLNALSEVEKQGGGGKKMANCTNLCLTPGTNKGSCFLSSFVEWIRFDNLTSDWLHTHFGPSC